VRRLERSADTWAPIIVPGASVDRRSGVWLTGQLTLASGMHASACLRCPDQPCRRSTGNRVDGNPDLCPVDALSIDPVSGSVMVDQECISCGVCVLRCPVGAFSPEDQGRIQVNSAASLGSLGIESDALEFALWRAEATRGTVVSRNDREAFIDLALRAAAPLGGRQFYPLVASLFRAIGVPATVSNPGDTSNRIDLVLDHSERPIPVEVKSRTEVEAINTKSVQQALENKLAISRLTGRQNLDDTASLVVGYDYPPQRSGVDELVDDIFATYGIKIGLISLRRLYELLLECNLDELLFDRQTLVSIRGRL